MVLRCQYKPAQLQAHLQFAQATPQTKNCKRAFNANADRERLANIKKNDRNE